MKCAVDNFAVCLASNNYLFHLNCFPECSSQIPKTSKYSADTVTNYTAMRLVGLKTLSPYHEYTKSNAMRTHATSYIGTKQVISGITNGNN
jgi:hypothetical protein